MVQVRVPKFGRWIGAAYAIVFLAATSAPPHHHLNGIEDLLSDGPSDSGLVLVRRGFQSAGGSVIEAVQMFDDDPCLACFPHDFVAAASCVFVLSNPSTPRARIEAAPGHAAPQPGDRLQASRSPPGAS
jgi:hypothetical protein